MIAVSNTGPFLVRWPLLRSARATTAGKCTRARLSSDGKFYTCLFAADGADLRGPMRGGASDAELLELIRAVWERRADRYSELRDELRARNARHVEMNHVGG